MLYDSGPQSTGMRALLGLEPGQTGGLPMNVILVGFIIMAQTAGAGNIDSVYMPFGNMTECAKAKAFFEA